MTLADPASAPDETSLRALIRHAVDSIQAAEHFANPFPHIVFTDLLPDDIYRTVIDSFPPDSIFDKLTKDGSRMSLDLEGPGLERIDPGIRRIWALVSAMLSSKEIEAAVRDRLADGLEIRRRGDKLDRPEDLRMSARPVLYRDRDGYQIKPHPDTRKKVITMQLYCPSDESQRELGTTLYKSSIKGLLHPGDYFLEPVKTFPFLPNYGYAFVVLKPYHSLSQTSWHGRPPIDVPVDRPRMSILNTFYA